MIEVVLGNSCYIPPYYGGSGTLRRAESNQGKIECSLRFYPNPCQDYLIFQLNEKSKDYYNFMMYDELGRLVSAETFSTLLGQIMLDMSSYPSGIYQVIVYSATDVIIAHEKVIKTE